MVCCGKEWKILRVLTTNVCNYECVYCHNEGQEHCKHLEMVTFEQFKKYYSIASKSGVQEVRFSGGEPLLNPETIRMIEWLNENSDVEIGLATNGSEVTEDIASKLGCTRVMVTLHFPGVGKDDYFRVTKRDWSSFENCVELFDKYKVDYSFNYTLYPDTISAVNNVIDYSRKKGKRVKLLPYLEYNFQNMSLDALRDLYKKLDDESKEKIYHEKEGYYLWTFESGAVVKIIDSPCYSKNISLCKAYGEIRLLPDLSLMNCIFGKKIQTKNMSNEELEEHFKLLWDNMKSCSDVIDM